MEVDEGTPAVKIQEVKNVQVEKRVASHSHITGLGLDDKGYAQHTASGFVGQAKAREVKFDVDVRI